LPDQLLADGLAQMSNLRNICGVFGVDEMKNIPGKVFFPAKTNYYLLELIERFFFKVPAHNRQSLPEINLTVDTDIRAEDAGQLVKFIFYQNNLPDKSVFVHKENIRRIQTSG
jgi:hypothetical protein